MWIPQIYFEGKEPIYPWLNGSDVILTPPCFITGQVNVFNVSNPPAEGAKIRSVKDGWQQLTGRISVWSQRRRQLPSKRAPSLWTTAIHLPPEHHMSIVSYSARCCTQYHAVSSDTAEPGGEGRREEQITWLSDLEDRDCPLVTRDKRVCVSGSYLMGRTTVGQCDYSRAA